MSSVIIVGAQWGDEGKGKLVDHLTEKADVVARYQGGHNAGHTVVVNNDKFILHIVPSGILHKGKVCVIGNGTVVDPFNFVSEIEGLRKKGIEVGGNLLLGKSAHLIMPYHMALESASESRKGKSKIGTTGKGIGPAYTDKMSRTGLRVMDLLYPDIFREKLEKNLAHVNAVLKNVFDSDGFDADEMFDKHMECAEELKGFVADTDIVLDKAIRAGKNVLFEGAQGTLLDIDHGTYPFVTSSSSTAGGACIGTGVGPTRINNVVGVVKAYTTRVGEGPFPTEIGGPLGEDLRERGGEYGATTGRPRRCGWLDIVGLRHAVRVNGLTGLAITKLDILDPLDEIKVCTAYEYEGRKIEEYPKELHIFEKCKPVFKTLKGWKGSSTTGLSSYGALPDGAKAYVKAIEEMLGTPVVMISTGEKREALIVLKEQY